MSSIRRSQLPSFSKPIKSKTDNFELAFKYGGFAYLLMVGFLAINTLWPAEYKWTYRSTVWQLAWVFIALIIITIFLPYTMDKLVNYLAMKEAQFDPGSRGPVPKNKLGIKSKKAMDEAESG